MGTARRGARPAQTLALSDSPFTGIGDRGPDGNGASREYPLTEPPGLWQDGQ